MVIAVWFILILIWCLQYSQLGELSVGPISYSEDQNGNLLPLVICKSLYKKRSLEPLKQAFEIDTDLETGEKSTISLAHYIYIIIIINVVLWFKSVSLYLSVFLFVFYLFFFFSACLSFDPKSVKQWKMQNSSFFDLDFYRYAVITPASYWCS